MSTSPPSTARPLPLLLLGLGGLWLVAPRASAEGAAPGAAGAPLTVVAAGDTMMGSDRVKGAAGLPPDDGAMLFADTAPVFSAADVAFLNLEGPLAEGLSSPKCAPTSTDCYAFRTPTRFVQNLVRAGIDVVSLANNHANDLGEEGLLSTMRTLDAAGIAHAGRRGDVGVLERGGRRIAVVGAHSGSCCVNVNDLDEVRAAVRAADEGADIVIFAFHGGAEGAEHRHVPGAVEIAWGEPRGDVKALGRAAVEAGADLVIGTGPHVLRAMEVHQGRLIAYSLGNYTGFRQFGTKGGPGGTSALLEARLGDDGRFLGGRLVSLALDGESVPHLDPTGAGARMVDELSRADFPETGVRVAADGSLSWGAK